MPELTHAFPPTHTFPHVQLVITNWSPADLINTGTIESVGFRPQKIEAFEPYCKKCGNFSYPVHVIGRWDNERKATAIPFDPVYVKMKCGCEFGDETLGDPPHE